MTYVGCIYRHWIINDKGCSKSYIGKHMGKEPSRNRWGVQGKHYAPKKGKKPSKFYNAIEKYGWDSFNHEIIGWCEAENKDELNYILNEWECYYIEKYDSYYNGYNGTTGGDGTRFPGDSNPRARKVVCLNTGEIFTTLTEASKKYGTTRSKIACVCSGTGVYAGKDEYNNKMYWAYYEDYKDMTEAHINAVMNKQQKHDNCCKSVICLTTGAVFEKIIYAEKWCGSGAIGQCCKGKCKTAGKHPDTGERLKWMYYDEWLEQQEKDKKF